MEKMMTMHGCERGKLHIAAAILMGGRSKRMGSPKENVVIPGDGRTFFQKIADEVDAAYPEYINGRYLSVRPDQKIERPGYLNVPDRFSEIGPLGGIASVLDRAGKDGYDAVLFLACDLINYEAEEIRNICGRFRGEDILFVRTAGTELQPLSSVYSVSALPSVLAMIEEGNYRIRDLRDRLRNVRYYDTEREICYVNQNSPF